MTDTSHPLRIGVVIPTLNSAKLLGKHIEAINSWAGLVEEIVVVDSFSEDGTLQLMRDQLSHPNIRFLLHPRGLYQSWNYGISQLRSEYTYISTAGDSISAEGLKHLYDVACNTSADVVISPPLFVHTDGKIVETKRATLYRFMQRAGRTTPYQLSSLEAFLWCALRLPGTILESSASNLYRTTLLQSRPFPLDFHSGGDSAWALQNVARVRLTATPRPCAYFLRRQQAEKRRRDNYLDMRQKLHALAKSEFERILSDPLTTLGAAEWKPLMESFWKTAERAWIARDAYAERRLVHRSIHPAMWLPQLRRRRATNELHILEQEIGERLAMRF